MRVRGALAGSKAQLRAPEVEDLDRCMEWINDWEVVRNLISFTFPCSRLREREWLEKAAKGEDPANKVFTIETEDGTYLGNIGLHDIDYASGTAELGIVIGSKEHWGRGYGTDAARVLLRFAFANMGLRKVFLRVFGFNERAIKSYLKLGFREVGRLKEHSLREGRHEDVVYMEVFAHELT
jgi:RimJ/RimL family protein N-acetyltransferase